MPTQTYNPTTSWNNSSQYQENGDISDADVLQLTGKDALDNVAYLTGDRTYSQVRQLGTVADLAALKAIGSSVRRDQDYVHLDDTKRNYQFDAASAATGDDYAVVTPTSGTGRWILQSSAVPKTTTMRWVRSPMQMQLQDVGGGTLPTWSDANQQLTDTDAQNFRARGQFNDLNPGDTISSIECVGVNSGGTLTATFYQVSCASGATAPTVTALGTLTLVAGVAEVQTSSAAPLPITIPAATGYYAITFVVDFQAGAGDVVTLSWVALNGTRSYITQ